jgi:hypothetical protein
LRIGPAQTPGANSSEELIFTARLRITQDFGADSASHDFCAMLIDGNSVVKGIRENFAVMVWA